MSNSNTTGTLFLGVSKTPTQDRGRGLVVFWNIKKEKQTSITILGRCLSDTQAEGPSCFGLEIPRISYLEKRMPTSFK